MTAFYKIINSFGIGLILLLLCAFFHYQSDVFFTSGNFSRIFIHTAVNVIMAVGMTFVISAAEIDLSVGSLLALCGMITAFILKIDPETGMNLPIWLANTLASPLPDLFPGHPLWWVLAMGSFLILALLTGAIAGGVTGFIVVRFGIPSFIVTLGFMMFHRGLARFLTNSAPVTGMPPQFTLVGSGHLFDIYGFRVSYSLIIALAVVLVGILLLNYTRFGRNVLAVGGNKQASYLSGVPVRFTKFMVFVIAGMCVSIASVIQTSRLFIGDPNAGEGYELDAIAAVIVGGTSLFGGNGTVVGTFFGSLIIGVLRNGLDLMGVQDNAKLMVIGGMIIFAVLLDYYRRYLVYSQNRSSI